MLQPALMRGMDMGTHPVQGGGQDPHLWGSERGPRPGEEYVRPGRRPSTPPRVGRPGDLLGLPLAGGLQFELQPQVGPLSLCGGGHWPEEGIRRADSGETLTERGRSGIG